MEEKWGTWGIVIFLIILFAVFWGGGFGFGGRGAGAAYAADMYGFEDYKAICEAQKQNIANVATTQYLVEQQASQTRELIAASANATQTKIDYYGYQNERDKNAELARENSELRNKLFVKDQLEPINATLASIQCNMLRRPDVTGIGAVCPNAGIINGLGLTSLNPCGCNLSNGLV